jgi:aminoglycoside phosphotransferase (APT) family kinase protein
MPAAEVDIDATLVRALLRDQAPGLAHLDLVEIASGWDNVMYRLGDELSVRVPRRALAAELVEHEQRWLPALAPRLPIRVPTPVLAGRPGHGYPWCWSVCPWLDGEIAADAPLASAQETAAQLGEFLAALHQPAPIDAPRNDFRGVPLADRSAVTHERIEQVADALDAAVVRACWEELAATPPWEGPALWLHGDLHPKNILVRDGRVSAVIDFGDVTSGDPATDLAVAWMLLPPDARPELRRAAGTIDDDTWRRARGWALCLGIATLAGSADDATLTRIARATIAAAIDG